MVITNDVEIQAYDGLLPRQILAMPTSDGNGFDILLHELGEGGAHQELLQWYRNNTKMHNIVPDFHRLQIERWLWNRRNKLQGTTLDIGTIERRTWIQGDYITVGDHTYNDILCDIGHLYTRFEDGSVDAIICTEVLEHVKDPFDAVDSMHNALRTGGTLLVTSPFIWPWHGKPDEYSDYWRFTHEGWRLLLKNFSSVDIKECQWTVEGLQLYNMLRRFEGFGFSEYTVASTGYLCEAVK